VGVNESEGGQSRKRSRLRGLLLALTALAVLAGAVVGGIVLDRLVLDDESAGITDAEHDRLIDACVAKDLDRASCTSWLAGIVEVAEAEGVSYSRLAEYASGMLAAYDGLDEESDAEWRRRLGVRMQTRCDAYDDMSERLCAEFRGSAD
jgi:hypothetical protein